MRRAASNVVCILVVNDDPVILDLVAEQLGASGFSVSVADGVDSALQMLDRMAPNLVVVGWQDPQLFGGLAFRQIESQAPQKICRRCRLPIPLAAAFRRYGQQLPNAIGATRSPWSMCDEGTAHQALQRCVDIVPG